jgi:CRISPR-associated protein Csx17
MSTIHTVTLTGCSPVPLAHYLKALGILRLVAEQADVQAAGRWNKDRFELNSALDESGLVDFFLNRYAPTPVLAPWNGDGGFFEDSRRGARETLDSFEKSLAPRLMPYRESIRSIRLALAQMGMTEKPADVQKEALLMACRNCLPDLALAWLDAVSVLTDDGAKFPPLLGTGGNDGSLDFSKNLMQRFTEVFDTIEGTAMPKSEGWLRGSLFAQPAATPLSKSPVGQFFPGAAGGVNATSGFDADSAVNPWDFILMIEGALFFAAASVKRLESTEPGVLVYPFCVKQSGVGYGSASKSDENDKASRAEMWMPLWDKPAKANELQAVLSEGRAQVGGRPARNGVDFARAVVTLGVDRGISSFQRYGFQVRNGLSYFATPLNRVTVKPSTRATLLGEIDPWLASLRRATSASAKPAAPASVSRAFNQLDARILDLCNHDRAARLQAVLIALGRCEKAIAKSSRWSDEARLNPLCELSLDWANLSDTGNAEFRLASALASVTGKFKDAYLTTRCHMEPVNCFKGDKYRWSEVETNNVQWSESPLPTVLNDIFARRLILAEKAGTGGLPDYARRFACLSDIKDFIEQRTDDTLLTDLLWGLSLINWTDAPKLELQNKRVTTPALFAILKLCFLPMEKSRDGVPLVPAIHHHAARGNGLEASRLASRRLRGSGVQPAIREIPLTGIIVQRTAAALIFPLPFFEIKRLRQLVERPTDEDSATSIQHNLETTSV